MSRLAQPSTAAKGGSECFHCRRHHQPMPPLLGSGPQAAPDLIQNWGYKTLYNHCRRWPETGVFRLIFSELSRSRDREPEAGATPEAVLMMPPTSKSIALPPAQKRGRCPSLDRWRQGGLTSKLYVVCDGKGRLVRLHLSEGQCSDFTGADLLLREPTITEREIPEVSFTPVNVDTRTAGIIDTVDEDVGVYNMKLYLSPAPTSDIIVKYFRRSCIPVCDDSTNQCLPVLRNL